MAQQNNLRLCGIEPESIVDGPGFRYVVFVQGCPHNCKGCHNPEAQSFDYGEPLTEELKKAVTLDSKEEENRTRVMRIVYKPENAKKIAQAMKELCVSFEFINTDF